VGGARGGRSGRWRSATLEERSKKRERVNQKENHPSTKKEVEKENHPSTKKEVEKEKKLPTSPIIGL
jgi:hypothetical protein